MFICHQKQFTYVGLTKSGSSTMYRVLKDNFNGVTRPRHNRSIPKEAKHYYNFFVVRNPYGRLVSWWWSICVAPKRDRYGHWKELNQMGLDKSLKSFLLLWDTKPASAVQQVVPIENNAPFVTNVIKLENLQQEFNQLPFVDKKIEIPHSNKKDHPHWSELVDDETIKMINKSYQRDFECLGYDML